MIYQKVTVYIDIQAPRQEVFSLITHLERRLQLSPLWGVASVEAKNGNYPQVGSSYKVRLTEGEQPPYETVITTYEPYQKFAYCLDVDRQTSVTWTLQEIKMGTRLTYEEEFLVDEQTEKDLTQSVRTVVHNWLENIQRYAELRQSKSKLLARWLVDRFYLGLRPDQRRVILTIIFMQAVAAIAFIMAALGMGLVSLFIK
jgi:uncharacterized protein YndB with AHSA1/START domain